MRVARQPSRWALRLALGSVLASVLLSSLMNVLVAWHLHSLTVGTDIGGRHAEATHGQPNLHATRVALDDMVERVCEAIKHCPCAVVWTAGENLTWPTRIDVGWAAQQPANTFKSYDAEVPQHPPNGAVAIAG